MKQLKPTIGKKTLFFLIMNAVIGTGIFFLPAIGAGYAGPASLISWVLMAIIAFFISLYFAELISMFPRSGGVYEYTKNAFGTFPSFIFGWTAWIVANITISMLIIGSLRYILPGQPMIFNVLFSVFFIMLFNFVSYRGIELSAKLLLFFGIMTMISLLLLIFPGLISVNPNNFQPFFVFPSASILVAMYFIAETFFGWETVGYLSEEVKDARKVIPKMLVITTLVIAVVSIAIAFVGIGMFGWKAFSEKEDPLAFLGQQLYGNDLAQIIALIVFIPLIGTAASWIVSSPRLLYAMSRDGVLPPSFSHVHKKYAAPHKAIIFQAIVSIFITIVALGDFLLVLSLLMPLAIFMYAGAMLSVVKLRIEKPKIKRYFSAPLPKIGPIIITVFLFVLMAVWLAEIENALAILLMGLILIILGAPLYILIRLQKDERFTEKFFDSISFVWDRAFPIWYGKKEAAAVVKRLGLGKTSTVLDFGCGSGITTMAIARKASAGMVVGVDISENQLESAIKKIKKTKMNNVILVKEENMRFKKNTFDAVAAVGVLEYLDRPRQTIGKMFSFLKKGGRFSFLSFGRSLGTPSPVHLSSESEIRKLFSGINAELHIKKEKKKMTEYWHIWGKKLH